MYSQTKAPAGIGYRENSPNPFTSLWRIYGVVCQREYLNRNRESVLQSAISAELELAAAFGSALAAKHILGTRTGLRHAVILAAASRAFSQSVIVHKFFAGPLKCGDILCLRGASTREILRSRRHREVQGPERGRRRCPCHPRSNDAKCNMEYKFVQDRRLHFCLFRD